MTEREKAIRRTVYYSGRVQGVGFRATTEMLARRFPVTGTVRNLDDGRVELVVEGPRRRLDDFLGAIRSAMAGNIGEQDVEESPASGAFHSFRVVG